MDAAIFRARRDALGLSQAQLATRMSTSVNNVQNWESGRYRVPALADAALRRVEEDLTRTAVDAARGELFAALEMSHAMLVMLADPAQQENHAAILANVPNITILIEQDTARLHAAEAAARDLHQASEVQS